MARVYTADPNRGPDERSLKGCTVTTEKGVVVPLVTRVEFAGDACEGVATVTSAARDADGKPIIDPVANFLALGTYRAWVRVWQPGEVVAKTPNVRLWRNGAGGVVAGPDLFPAVPFTTQEQQV